MTERTPLHAENTGAARILLKCQYESAIISVQHISAYRKPSRDVFHRVLNILQLWGTYTILIRDSLNQA